MSAPVTPTGRRFRRAAVLSQVEMNRADRNSAAQRAPDLILASAVCCRGVRLGQGMELRHLGLGFR